MIREKGAKLTPFQNAYAGSKQMNRLLPVAQKSDGTGFGRKKTRLRETGCNLTV
ncbi:hypothetical protein HMPREF9374_3515 [Desmospora sp. 8437]|nr:hypothetical protein HMPREF9374_3515 [Desmospora sp. 8437]